MAESRGSGRKVRKVRGDYTVQLNGKQERKFAADWTEEDGEPSGQTILAKDSTKARPKRWPSLDRYLRRRPGSGPIAETGDAEHS